MIDTPMLLRNRVSTALRIVPAAAILVWRVSTCAAAWLWQDLLFWLAAYWLITELVSKPRIREGAALVIASFLFGVYAWGHAPLVLSALGIWP